MSQLTWLGSTCYRIANRLCKFHVTIIPDALKKKKNFPLFKKIKRKKYSNARNLIIIWLQKYRQSTMMLLLVKSLKVLPVAPFMDWMPSKAYRKCNFLQLKSASCKTEQAFAYIDK